MDPRRPRRRQREIDIAREISYIMSWAAAGGTRIVGLGPLVLFGTPGSAWVRDAGDSLAYCLMNDYTPRPSPLRFETQERYALAWEATVEVREGCFWTRDERRG